MKKLFFLAILLLFAACKKNSSAPPLPPPPDITESLNVSIVTQNPDKYDSARGHVSDSFSWSIPHAYGDTCVVANNGNFVLPPNATTLMLEFLEDNYGIGNAAVGQSWIAVNNGPDLLKEIKRFHVSLYCEIICRPSLSTDERYDIKVVN